MSEQPCKRRKTETETETEGVVTGNAVLHVKDMGRYEYMSGFGCELRSEALKGAVPEMYNTPQVAPHGLYAEQLSGTAFTKPRDCNRRSWLYKIMPSAKHSRMTKVSGFRMTENCTEVDPMQRRWAPFPQASKKTTWLEGMTPYAGAGDPQMKAGTKIYLYACNTSMGDSCFYSSDGDMLFVPESGSLDITTEFGKMEVRAGEICVIQRGIKFKVDLLDGAARGYVCELFDGHFKLPDLGPIGANGLANSRDFLTPTAWYEDVERPFTIYNKFCGDLFTYTTKRSPFDVCGWHGNYAPFKYDLARFCAVNSVTYDHLDPSIFTVLTCQTADPGTAAMDFVIFPPRYMVQMNTFRPPYYHRNCMSELMGNITGAYEAKEKGFLPGGVTLHSCMTGHGPDAFGFDKASKLDTKEPQKPSKTDLAFMFESTYMFKLSKYAAQENVDANYNACWDGLQKNFKAQ